MRGLVKRNDLVVEAVEVHVRPLLYRGYAIHYPGMVPILFVTQPIGFIGAQGGTRTHTSFRTTDFKSVASTSSATRA